MILACSPRPGGNSDTAARLFARAAGQRLGLAAPLPVTLLRSFRIAPCLACSACAQPDPSSALGLACPQSREDDSIPLLQALAQAPCLCLISPIFFYHLPSPLKALLDRTQPFWLRPRERALPPPRLCRIILIAGRTRGKSLFAGSLLSLRYALDPLNVRLAEPLLLRGLEEPGALASSPEASLAVSAYGQEAAGDGL